MMRALLSWRKRKNVEPDDIKSSGSILVDFLKLGQRYDEGQKLAYTCVLRRSTFILDLNV